MKYKLILTVLIFLSFRFSYAQQSDTAGNIYSGNFPSDTADTEIQSEFFKPLNLRECDDFIFELNETLEIKGFRNQQHPSIFKNKNYQKSSLSLNDTGKYHSFLPEYNPKSNIFIPIAGVMEVNFFLFYYNKYVLKQDYVKISLKTVIHNLDTGFVWDEDVYHTNQLRHPVHASLLFNAARSAGYSFWESIPFVFWGSAVWEILMEKDPPQANDMITSTIGGVSVGEITYRLSSLILDESTSGFNRVFRELFAFCVNPVRGVNRIIRGEVSRKTPFNVNDVFPVYNRLNFGYAGNNGKDDAKREKKHLLFEYSVTYGSTFEKNTFKPFDFFRVRVGFDFKQNEQAFFWNNIYGLLYGKNIVKNSDSRFVLGAFHGIDYFYNYIYRLSTQSLGLGFIYVSPVKNKLKANVILHTNFVPLGAVNSIFRRGPNRDYDFVIGNKTMLEASLSYGPLMLMLEYEYYYLKTIEGAPGHSNISLFNPKLYIDIYNGLGLGVEYLIYSKSGTYKNLYDYNHRTDEHRLFLTYTL